MASAASMIWLAACSVACTTASNSMPLLCAAAAGGATTLAICSWMLASFADRLVSL
jgi:hypothetical protein